MALDEPPEVGAEVVIEISGGVQCSAIVIEITKDTPPCVVCELPWSGQRFHVRLSEIESVQD